MYLKVGERLRSQVDSTEVIVVRAPGDNVELTCGGHPMIAFDATPDAGLAADPAMMAGSPIGKRFASPQEPSLEVLVTNAGPAGLAVGDVLLIEKVARALPSSD
jgi:hypothetical protein